jgi:hypothetical protein
MAAESKGFFCAKTIAVETSVRMSQRRIHDDCNPTQSLGCKAGTGSSFAARFAP